MIPDESGLIPYITLQNNGEDDLRINTNGSFVFDTPLDDLSSFEVTVASSVNVLCDIIMV